MKKMKSLMTAFAFGGLLLISSTGFSQEKVDVISGKSFSKTVDALNTSIKSKGMMIVATVNHQNMLKMTGLNIKGATTIEFGKPDMGKMVFANHPEAGLEMPARIYVYERADGKTVISYYKSNFAKYDKSFEMIDNMMAMAFSEITNAAK